MTPISRRDEVWKDIAIELRTEWKNLWRDHIEDKMRAEGLASNDFPKLFVERGMVITATRDYKPPDFYEILEKHVPKHVASSFNIAPTIGGIRKFIREEIRGRKVPSVTVKGKVRKAEEKGGQRKHGGRGWLHHDYNLR
ncbi:MAG: hypothetical protein QXX94_07125 [Candidatus Bathyarchaeia archaeon]